MNHAIVKSTRVSQFCTSSDDNSERISNVIGMLSRKQYYMILYSRFYKECIWREKRNKLNNYHDYRLWTKVLVTLTVFCKIIPGKLLKLHMEKVPNDRKLVFVINILTVVVFMYQPF